MPTTYGAMSGRAIVRARGSTKTVFMIDNGTRVSLWAHFVILAISGRSITGVIRMWHGSIAWLARVEHV